MIMFLFNSILMGFGLAMDAFSVSLANGLKETKMSIRKTVIIAGTFGVFQMIMPLVGWLCVHTISHYFEIFDKAVPFIALFLLVYMGIKMIREAKTCDITTGTCGVLTLSTLLLQAIATSIDALSVGFTISSYLLGKAFLATLIIGIMTFLICVVGLIIGKKAGEQLPNKAIFIGGIILIFLGIEIFVRSLI